MHRHFDQVRAVDGVDLSIDRGEIVALLGPNGAGGTGCRSLIVTTFGRPGYLRRALEAGASGFVVKDTPAEQLDEAALAARDNGWL